MLAPYHLRAALLKQAITEAADTWCEEIDKVEVVGDTVIVHAGGKRMTLTYTMSHGDTLGSWSWDFISREVVPMTVMGRLRRLMGWS